MTIESRLKANAQKEPEKLALATLQGSLTYAGLWEKVNALAHILREDCGMRPGDHVLIRSSQTLEHAVSYFAIHVGGSIGPA